MSVGAVKATEIEVPEAIVAAPIVGAFGVFNGK
jgi:hypothetical protein